MKSIHKILSDSNLTPSERVILLVQSDVDTDQGKPELLSKADRNAISEGWTPKNNTEVREYNTYQKGWKFEGGLALDMQTQYLNTEIQVLKAGKMIEFALWAPLEQFKRTFDKIGKVNESKALENLLKNSGIEYDHLVHQLVMENLSDELKADLLALSPDFETDNSYFKEEEKLYNFLNNKEHLNKENKNELATLILSSIKWSLVKLLKEKKNLMLDTIYLLGTLRVYRYLKLQKNGQKIIK